MLWEGASAPSHHHGNDIVKSLQERFEAKISPEPNSGCWLWDAHVRKDGYGEIQLGSRGLGTELAHRVSYQLYVGDIAPGKELDHKCRVRSCVNPNHLEPVTRRENTMRGLLPFIQRMRHASITHCPAGHEYTDKNTHIAVTKRGYRNRMCKTCARLKASERRRRASA